ncbi:hypothetical protein [Brevibacterium linens]|uniref:hypothetical protein n=1 Tax=Brevibacterium linens TaxID=1703 RepID=UPI001379261A|nr:hypothetical protein [Brevibacterium linens]
MSWSKVVIMALADEGPITDFDTAVVLTPAAAVDEHICAETDVLAEVSAERREELPKRSSRCRARRSPNQPRGISEKIS